LARGWERLGADKVHALPERKARQLSIAHPDPSDASYFSKALKPTARPIVRLAHLGFLFSNDLRKPMSNNPDNTQDPDSRNQRQASSRRGFASMDPERQRQIASRGGKAAHASGNAHQFNATEAREAGRKGGLAGRRTPGSQQES
jgi:general stress protein YciG